MFLSFSKCSATVSLFNCHEYQNRRLGKIAPSDPTLVIPAIIDSDHSTFPHSDSFARVFLISLERGFGGRLLRLFFVGHA
tara:strand:- start:12339 stop:12578 length:240 start_codon:yes stop_codon:yes gene_type:complete